MAKKSKKDRTRAKLEAEAEKMLATRRDLAARGLIEADPEEIPDKPLYVACATGSVNDIMRALGFGG